MSKRKHLECIARWKAGRRRVHDFVRQVNADYNCDWEDADESFERLKAENTAVRVVSEYVSCDGCSVTSDGVETGILNIHDDCGNEAPIVVDDYIYEQGLIQQSCRSENAACDSLTKSIASLASCSAHNMNRISENYLDSEFAEQSSQVTDADKYCTVNRLDTPHEAHINNDDTDCDWQAADSDDAEHPVTDSDTDDHAIPFTQGLEQDLAQWACKHNVTHSALGDLLKLLQNYNLNVPACAKTLLKTPRTTAVQQKSGGDYIYLGLKCGLISQLQSLDNRISVTDLTVLQLSFNIDGLPLFSSSPLSIWPILCVIANIKDSKPFPVALFCGSQKPVNLDFTLDFIYELKTIMQSGLEFNRVLMGVEVHSFICDSPAKSLVKATVQHNGYFGCDRCEQKGVYDGRMTYPETVCVLRTNESFRDQSNKEHHKGVSPFCEIDIDMIKKFPIDYMHQVNLGVMKRLLLLWINGPLKTRLSSGQTAVISGNLNEIRQFIPNNFARKPRSLQYIRRWKATEFRQFLMYTGVLVLKDVLPKDLYENFMCLHVGCNLLMNPVLVRKHADYARELLQYFVQNSAEIYGRKFVTYNVHSLLHLTEVAEDYDCLEKCSAYQFENYLQTLKRLVRSPQNPIAQVARRLMEISASSKLLPEKWTCDAVKTAAPDNCFRLASGCYCLVHDKINDGKEVLCEVFNRARKLYDDPCDSRLLGELEVNLRLSVMKKLPITDISEKAVFIKLSNTSAAIMPLAHSHSF